MKVVITGSWGNAQFSRILEKKIPVEYQRIQQRIIPINCNLFGEPFEINDINNTSVYRFIGINYKLTLKRIDHRKFLGELGLVGVNNRYQPISNYEVIYNSLSYIKSDDFLHELQANIIPKKLREFLTN